MKKILKYEEKLCKISSIYGISLSTIYDNEWLEIIKDLEFLNVENKKKFLNYRSEVSTPKEYEKHLERYGIKVLALSEEEQSTVSAVIFDQIKAGLSPDVESLLKIAEALYSRGAELVVLGCTELSLLKKNNRLPNYVIDSLELLALCVISQMGKTPQNFDPELMKFYGSAGKDTD